jgi:hypothetical protein
MSPIGHQYSEDISKDTTHLCRYNPEVVGANLANHSEIVVKTIIIVVPIKGYDVLFRSYRHLKRYAPLS